MKRQLHHFADGRDGGRLVWPGGVTTSVAEAVAAVTPGTASRFTEAAARSASPRNARETRAAVTQAPGETPARRATRGLSL